MDFENFRRKSTISAKILAHYVRSPRACTTLDAPCTPVARCVRASRAPRSLRSLAFLTKSTISSKMAIFFENRDFHRKSAIFDENPRKSSIFEARALRALAQRVAAHVPLDEAHVPATRCVRAAHAPRSPTLARILLKSTIFAKWRFSTKIAIFVENLRFSRFSPKSGRFWRKRSLAALARAAHSNAHGSGRAVHTCCVLPRTRCARPRFSTKIVKMLVKLAF